MSRARIVYSGAIGGGTLFTGTKFYLLQRIPSRDRWRDMILSNGGEIVNLEAQADMIIADHARPKQPPGSISWTYIEKSVQKGELEDIEDHRVTSLTKTTQVGAAHLTRNTRTPFTTEDDQLLMEWCTRAERKGVSLKGNILYQQLEEKNNRHSYQSWRDRWIKYLSKRPRPDLKDEDSADNSPREIKRQEPNLTQLASISPRIPSRLKVATDAPKQSDSSQRKSPSRSSVERKSTSHAPVNEESEQGESPSRRSPNKETSPIAPSNSSPLRPRSSGNIFFEAETQKLIEYYDNILGVDEDRKILFWNTWAAQHDEHTAQEWYNHFREYVKPKMETRAKPKELVPSAQKRSPEKESTPKTSSSKIAPEMIEINPLEGQSVSRSGESFSQDDRPIDPSTLDEMLFVKDLSTLAANLSIDLDFHPTICGRPISLFKLWQIVESPEFGGIDRVDEHMLWPKVARQFNLGFDKHPEAATELKTCFDIILADFEDVRRLVVDAMHESVLLEAQLMEMTNHQSEDGGSDDQDDNLDAPQFSSPRHQNRPVVKKRGPSDINNTPTIKRQRVDKGKGREREIPSTPEVKMPASQVFHMKHDSPLKLSSFTGGEDVNPGEDTDDELFVPQIEPQISKGDQKNQPQSIEPETQDFSFPGPQKDSMQSRVLSSPPSSPPSLPSLMRRNQVSPSPLHGRVPSLHETEESFTQSHGESQKAVALQDIINSLVEEGYVQEAVIEALKATTMEPIEDVKTVAENLELGEGIPDNLRGVWTVEDDEALNMPMDTQEYRHIVVKHGTSLIRGRNKFLELVRESESRYVEASDI